MQNHASRARSYREKAAEAVVFGEQMATLKGKRMMAAMARDFTQIAEMLEEHAAQYPVSSTH